MRCSFGRGDLSGALLLRAEGKSKFFFFYFDMIEPDLDPVAQLIDPVAVFADQPVATSVMELVIVGHAGQRHHAVDIGCV